MTNEHRDQIRFTARTWFEEGFSATGRQILRLLALALVIYVVQRSHTIVITLIMAGILACAASGPVDFICRERWRRWFKGAHQIRFPVTIHPHGRRALAAALVLVMIIATLVGIITLFLHPIQMELMSLQTNWKADYQPLVDQRLLDTQNWYATLSDWVHDLVNKQAPDWLRNLLDPNAPDPTPNKTTDSGGDPEMAANAGKFLMGFLGKLAGLLNGVVELILLPVLAFYLLVEGRSLRNELVRFVPSAQQRTALALLRESAAIMRSYLIAQLLLATIAGVFVGTMLGVAHIPYALVLALVAGITRAIPVIGPLLGGIPVGVIVFVECSRQGNYTLLVVVMTLFIAMHLLESKALTPFILGKGLNLHPIIVIVALLIGGEFFGLMGMFLAAPVTALVRTILFSLFIHRRHPRHRKSSRLVRALSIQKEP